MANTYDVVYFGRKRMRNGSHGYYEWLILNGRDIFFFSTRKLFYSRTLFCAYELMFQPNLYCFVHLNQDPSLSQRKVIQVDIPPWRGSLGHL